MSGDPNDPVVGPTWFAMSYANSPHETIARVLVIGGRIAAHSWGSGYVGQAFAPYQESAAGNGWTVEELANV
jgi:hypothetical protein